MSDELSKLAPDRVFDGGELDCGSGLVLLLREAMSDVPVGGVLEMRSREPTVRDDLPPWCRLTGHQFLGELPGSGAESRYLIRRGSGERAAQDAAALDADKQKAKAYEWRVRARSTGPLSSRAYCRNFQVDVGQPASFEERDLHPSAVELLLAALAGDLASGMAVEASRSGVLIDDLELVLKARLANVLAHLGVEEGDPGLASVDVKCFASTGAPEAEVLAVWHRVVARSPLAATLARACALTLRLSIA